jgi:hypothetical protein
VYLLFPAEKEFEQEPSPAKAAVRESAPQADWASVFGQAEQFAAPMQAPAADWAPVFEPVVQSAPERAFAAGSAELQAVEPDWRPAPVGQAAEMSEPGFVRSAELQRLQEQYGQGLHFGQPASPKQEEIL